MAATNSIEHLDPAVIRPGRFDRHIRIDLPDAEARRAIFEAELDDRPAAHDIDLDEPRDPNRGDDASRDREDRGHGGARGLPRSDADRQLLELDTEHLLAAIERYGGEDRPTVEHWSWDSLILPRRDQGTAAAAAGGDRGSRVGKAVRRRPTDRPPPRRASRHRQDDRREGAGGTGAGVLLSDLGRRRDQQVGRRLRAEHPPAVRPRAREPPFDRLHRRDRRDRRPSRRVARRPRQPRQSAARRDRRPRAANEGCSSSARRTGPISSILRSCAEAGCRGRSSSACPDEAGRLAMLKLHTARMPTVGVRLEELAAATDGLSPADLKSLAQEAALAAMARTTRRTGHPPSPTRTSSRPSRDSRPAASVNPRSAAELAPSLALERGRTCLSRCVSVSIPRLISADSWRHEPTPEPHRPAQMFNHYE